MFFVEFMICVFLYEFYFFFGFEVFGVKGEIKYFVFFFWRVGVLVCLGEEIMVLVLWVGEGCF